MQKRIEASFPFEKQRGKAAHAYPKLLFLTLGTEIPGELELPRIWGVGDKSWQVPGEMRMQESIDLALAWW